MTTTFNFSIQSDFPNHAVDLDRLTNEIHNSSITIALDRIDKAGDVCSIVFKTDLSLDDVTTLNALVAAHSGEVLLSNTAQPVRLYIGNNEPVPTTSLGMPIVATAKSDGSRANFFTYNWCDKTTWYMASTRVADETATDSGDHLTFTLAHQNVVDTYHGKITGEDYLLDSGNNSYRVTVKVNGVAKAEQDPHAGAGSDYTIDYAAGTVTFLSALAPTDVVTVTYHYAGSSLFTIKPTAGKKLTIDLAEVQFSTDIILNDTVMYNAFGLVDVFAPQLLQTNGGPYPSGTMIPLANPFVYKTIQDFLNDSIKAYPKYDAIGGSNWRAMTSASTVFNWDYIRSLSLSSAAGMEIRMWLEHDTAFGGTFATATFYCGSVNE